MMHLANFSGTVSFAGNRHCPSRAMEALNNSPSRLSITKEVGVLKSCLGRQNQKGMKKAKIRIRSFIRHFDGRRRFFEGEGLGL